MNNLKTPTIGLALSGSGNRTAFYIGFLEELEKSGIKVNFITSTSGGSIVALAYACGTMQILKDDILGLNEDLFKNLLNWSGKGGGVFTLDKVEDFLYRYSQGKKFEDLDIKMSFSCVDLRSGELIDLCMGDLAHAVRVSCTVPGLFEPVIWGDKALVDGGLICDVPLKSLNKFNPDIAIGVSISRTKNIFSKKQINFIRILKNLKKILMLDYFGNAIMEILKKKDSGREKDELGLFEILGRSIDVILKARENDALENPRCDIMIKPKIAEKTMRYFKKKDFSLSPVHHAKYLLIGKETAKIHIPGILKAINGKK